MTHEPGRERHMMHKCEHCSMAAHKLFHDEGTDEYWCESCIDNANEAAWDRHQAAGGSIHPVEPYREVGWLGGWDVEPTK